MFRVGIGTDRHRLVFGKKLILGGVKVDSPKGATGHSDQRTCFACHNQAAPVVAFATAKAGGFAALGVARHDDEALLAQAGADIVVSTLDDVDLAALSEGRLARRTD